MFILKKFIIFKNVLDLFEFFGNENDSIGFNLKFYRCIDFILYILLFNIYFYILGLLFIYFREG